jgi:hypothetical protein
MENTIVIKGLTDLEKIVLTTIAEGMYAEVGFSDVTIEDVVIESKLDSKIVRGVISSLIKKGLIVADKIYEFSPEPKRTFYCLTEKSYGLVEEYVGEEGILKAIIA